MRIIFVSNDGFQYLSAVLPALQQRGVEHRILALDELHQNGNGLPSKLGAFGKYYFDRNLIAAYRAEIETFRPDIIHVTGLRSVLIKTLVASGPYEKIAIVYERVSAGGMNPLNVLDRPLFGSRRIDRIVVPSHAMLNNWVGNPMLRSYVLRGRCEALHYAISSPPPIAGQRNAMRTLLGLPLNAFIVATTCIIRPWKNVEFVAEVVSSIQADQPLYFAVVGPASNDVGYMERIRRAGGSRLKLLGYIPNAANIMPAFDLYVTPTNPPGESFGMAFAEAMSHGVPGITMNYGAAAEICESGVSGFALSDSQSVWRTTIESLMRDPAKLNRMGEAARMRIRERFSPDVCAEEYLRVYGAVIAERSRRAQSGAGGAASY